MREYNKLLLATKTESEKSKVMKKIEKELKSEFEVSQTNLENYKEFIK